jgi:hypothetical protein
MSAKKTLILMGAMFFLVLGSMTWAEGPQDSNGQQAMRKAANKFQHRVLFIDENGDGICDYGYHLQDGKGAKYQKGNRNQNNPAADGTGSKNQNRWSKQSFGDKQNGFGSGPGNGNGSKGQNKGQNKGQGGGGK